VSNAIKFTPEGGNILVTVRPLDLEGHALAISVRDSGIGISEEQKPKIFEKFHQAESSLHRSSGGTGLGLAITKGLVEAHHGKISVESKVGEGSTFTFTLPTSKGERRKRHFRSVLDGEFQRAQRNHAPLTLILIEVSDARVRKEDSLLGQLEERVSKTLYRKSDIVIRWEKAKVLAILCQADPGGGEVIQQRIWEEVRKLPRDGCVSFPEIKIGRATYPDEATSKRELFERAKRTLRG
jgi:GGDEF domain-containing protein